jgi:hypothetical protein
MSHTALRATVFLAFFTVGLGLSGCARHQCWPPSAKGPSTCTTAGLRALPG